MSGPERIWIPEDPNADMYFSILYDKNTIEYVRADLYAKLEQERYREKGLRWWFAKNYGLAVQERDRLREALEEIADSGFTGANVVARAALDGGEG